MFQRLRRLKLSLAAKCQLLFGAAVLLIITAALYVPWQRMEQLMEQINERTARALAEWAEADHVAREMERRAAGGPSATRPGASATRPATGPATMPATGRAARTTAGADKGRNGVTGERPLADEVLQKAAVRMVLFARQPDELSRFEQRAIAEFQKDPEAEPMYRRFDSKEGPSSFRYARALVAAETCLTCHAADLPAAPVAPAADQPDESKRRPALLGMVAVEIPYQVDANQVFLNRLFIFLAGLLAGTLAIIVFYLITTRLILGPVRILQETAEKVSKGDLNIRSDISTGDEFQVLSETFNRMLANLKQGADQLRALNQSLDMKVGELAESNLALYESNRLKSEFLANVSHELKTPLNSILGFADLLRDTAAVTSDAKAARYAQNIINSGRNLLDLITDLLDLAKIEAGRMEVRSAPLSLSDLFEGLTSILKPLAEKKDVTIAASIGNDVPLLETDGGKLQQVLYNFLSNAIKFSPAGGRIDLRAERAGDDRVRISVADQGPGIEEEKQSVIFEKFRQVDASVTRQHGGTGLGLAISRELTHLLGGQIGLASRPGEGATFWIEIPLKIASHAQSLRAVLANH